MSKEMAKVATPPLVEPQARQMERHQGADWEEGKEIVYFWY